jgi:dTDP-4-dehydrorhamnose reductase
MKILLFGGSGQLGYEVRMRAHDLNFTTVAPVRSEVTITDLDQVRAFTAQTAPDIIINCAAYTAVDKAEEDKEGAYAINRDAVHNIAQAALDSGVRLIHVSTDYVFSGDGDRPLFESDPVKPKSIYGASKLAGELEVARILGDRGLVVRTSSLHGQKGVNFVGTMLKLFAEKPEVKIVSDQWMSPTWAGWLAEVLLDLTRIPVGGVLHASGAGSASWFEFAQAIYDYATSKKIAKLTPITAAEFGRPAPRPRYSVFDCSKLTEVLGRAPINWQEGLKAHLKEVGAL